MKRDYLYILIIVCLIIIFVKNNNDKTLDYVINTTSNTLTCDGLVVTSNCQKNGIMYEKYIYHQEMPEIKHEELKITYTTEIVGYCTLCNDGTRSPSCSVGRGTCSYHGGVREWNAPIYQDIEHKEYVTVVDFQAKPAYYETIIK